MKHKRWLLLAVCAAILWGAVRLLYFFYPPPPPMWPHEVVGTLAFDTQGSPRRWRFLAAQLTGEGGQELVGIPIHYASDPEDEAWPIRVYTWRGDGFRLLAEAELPLLPISPVAAGDVNGDGRDELFLLDLENRVLTVRLRDGALHVDHAQRLTEHWIEDMTLARLRPGEAPELVLLAASALQFPSGEHLGGGRGDLLSAHRWDGDDWEEAWRKDLPDGPFFSLFAEDILPEPGEELALGIFFRGVQAIGYELLTWDGQQLSSAGRGSTFREDPDGRPTWLGFWPDPRRGSNLIVASVFYGAEEPPVSRLELLDYDGGRLRKRYRLPDPAYHNLVALPGDFRGNGKTGILLLGDDRDAITYTLLEARR